MSLFSLNKKTKTAALLMASASIAAISLAFMPGCNGPDCQSAQLRPSYQKGIDRANVLMAEDDVRGYRDGMALTQEQGRSDGISIGYSEGFNEGRTNITAYNNGRARGYNEGKSAGLYDAYSIQQGNTDGYTDGFNDYRLTGEHDGYEDGYADGYDAGFAGGLVAPCSGSATSAEDMNTCENQGYINTYNDSYYIAGYLRGKNENLSYQNGLKNGRIEGYAAGLTDGLNQASIDGYNVGYDEGLTEGRTIAYTNAYNYSYTDGKNNGYSAGYNDSVYGYGVAPSIGSYSDGTGGFGDGAFDGYVDGRNSHCGGGGSLAKPAKRFGKGQKWAKIVNGTTVDAFAQRIDRVVLSNETKASIKAEIDASRKTLRDNKRWEIENSFIK